MKKITMFVWNNFVNDARVYREAKTLSTHYEVTIIAKREIQEKLKPVEKVIPNVYVNRPLKLELPQWVQKRISSTLLKKHVPNALLMFKMIMIGRKYSTDVYHAHDLNTLIQGILSAKLRVNTKPLIYDSHEVQTSRTHYSFKFVHNIERILLKFVDHVIVENETRANYHNSLYGHQPSAIYNYSEYYDIDEVEEIDFTSYGIPKRPVVLYQGGLQEGRGLYHLLDAFKHVNGAHLVFVGDGKEKNRLIEYHHKIGITDKVTFLDRVPYKELRRYTKSAYVGIQFLEHTNFNHYSASSNKLFEYVMAHVPVIGVDFPEISRIISEASVGEVVPTGNTKKLVEAIQTMIDHPELRDEYSKNCKVAKEKYNWSVEERKIINIYDTITT